MKKVNRGNAQLISLVLVLGLAMLAAPRGIEMIAQQQSQRIWDVTASQFNTVQMAAREYISDHIDTLATQVKPGHPVYVSVNTLKNTGHLPAGFGLNDHNQNYLIAVVSNPKMTSQLQAFVMTTGGHPWDFGALRYISSNISGLGGYVWPDNQATGAGGGWKMKLTDFGLNSRQGSLVTFIPSDQLGTSGQGNDRLYRYAVNGHPDFNRMHTSIDMNGNDLNNAGVINGKQATISGDIKSTNGWIVTQGSKGWMNESHGGGFYMSDNDWVRSVNNKGIYTGGQLKGGSVRSDSDLSAGGVLKLDKTSYAGTWCPQTGAISHDSSGGILSCQSGRWASGGGSTVKTGLIADGQQIPLPPGFNSNQCSWSVSNAQNPHGWKPNYFAGSVAYADVNRIVKCGYYDEYNFHAGTNRTDLSGQCSYVISCQ
ncbi:shufflon system plasmid conjugative transfer pilus tip adhesin PilV [Salmonella enterica subsp. diarizonae serovar 16:z10:e,n,x,z15]|uniref:shufflon system plasmid conjugative transfer pilus tip adhesin PilV n=1 Tax=Salmonella enterica TaxID=28901 RepID=UPI001F0F3E4D|nr:shufflon system plasmid conjugative transfer pilus tip adhesin PilV [Salmonella enterica subsp. diarizonae serovar 16:z10:e,n,x,z15]